MYRSTLLVGVFLGTCCTWMPRCALAAEPEARTVTVSAMAEVNVVPDQVVFTLGIRTEDLKTLAGAKAANDLRTQAVLAVVGKHGVPAKNIRISRNAHGPSVLQGGDAPSLLRYPRDRSRPHRSSVPRIA